MKKVKSALLGALKTIGLFIALSFLPCIYSYLKHNGTSWASYTFLQCLCLALGLLLGFLSVRNRPAKEGKWSVDALRLCLFGLPALFFGCYMNLYYATNWLRLPVFLAQQPLLSQLALIFLGYILPTSFKKTTVS